ncbi:MAG: UvrD-helicase domain-containing protein [Candidatus Handelsmanbacteria bacterium]|nr:UvrD-helicase domain-containing protein [Candidatus Handelsmanbacteria bacterium]
MAEVMVDQEARSAIARELHQNLMVLAGAGAGKTQALADRMAVWIGAGRGLVEEGGAGTCTRWRPRWCTRRRVSTPSSVAFRARSAFGTCWSKPPWSCATTQG